MTRQEIVDYLGSNEKDDNASDINEKKTITNPSDEDSIKGEDYTLDEDLGIVLFVTLPCKRHFVMISQLLLLAPSGDSNNAGPIA